MKKNLTKLALSGVALAAVAATLGTSTYAWYTTNPTVSANDIVAGTSDTGSSSIFISKDKGTTKNWSASVKLTSADFVTSNPSLVPVSYGKTGKFATLNTSTGALNDAATAGANVAQVTLYFKSSKTSSAQSIYIKSITVENTTADVDNKTDGKQLPTADNLLYLQKHGEPEADYTAAEVGVTSSDATYSVDFREALAMAVYNAGAQASTGSFDKAFSLADRKTNTDANPAPTGVLSTGKAQEYYDAVMETNLASGGAKTAAGTMATEYAGAAIAVCPVNGTDYATVNFYVYLDGASEFCYDACQGQQFSIDLQFTSDPKAAIGYTAPVEP